MQVTGSTYWEIVFQTMYISKIWHKLERNCKNSICIGVKNFANL